jgi:hypothetical protein
LQASDNLLDKGRLFMSELLTALGNFLIAVGIALLLIKLGSYLENM